MTKIEATENSEDISTRNRTSVLSILCAWAEPSYLKVLVKWRIQWLPIVKMQLLLFYINLVPINPTPCISNLLNLNFKSFLYPAKIDVMAKTSTITVDLGNIFNICCLTTHNAGKIAVRRYHFKCIFFFSLFHQSMYRN